MKVMHITVVRQLTSGQRKQLAYEVSASREISHEWRVAAYHCGEPVEAFERRIPLLFRGLGMRNLWAWFVTIRESRANDVVLCRHLVFDLFTFLFAGLVANRVTIHHAKESEELKLVRKGVLGNIASMIELKTGKHSLSRALAVLGVTDEIRKYQLARISGRKPSAVYPNGVLVDDVEMLADGRQSGKVEVAFMCGKFSSWHGLEKLIDSVRRRDLAPVAMGDVTIHLIGQLLPGQLEDIREVNEARPVFKVHGTLGAEQYRAILARCDLGLSSFALDQKYLSEAATLKVREYLALGLPVYSGHADVAVSADFPFYRIGPASVGEIESFATQLKQVSRLEVRELARDLIEKRCWMESIVDWLSEEVMRTGGVAVRAKA